MWGKKKKEGKAKRRKRNLYNSKRKRDDKPTHRFVLAMPSDLDELNLQLSHIQEHLEDNLQKAVVGVGMDPVPQDLVVPVLATIIMCIFSVLLIFRSLRNRLQHKRLYGDYAYPPFASQFFSSRHVPYSPSFYVENAARIGPVFRFRTSASSCHMSVAVGDLDTAKAILEDATTRKAEEHYSRITSVVGGPNVLTATGPLWKKSRKAIVPSFHINRVNRVCNEATEEWIQAELEPSIRDGEAIDIAMALSKFSLTVMCRVAFEYKIKKKEVDAVMNSFHIVNTEFSTNAWLRSSILGFLFSSRRRARIARRRLRSFAEKLLNAYRKKPAEAKRVSETILKHIDESPHYPDDEHRISDIVALLFTGYQSTAQTLAATLLELAKSQGEQNKLRDALKGKDDATAQRVLKDVIREGMRLHPSSSIVATRITGSDFFVKSTGLVIPKGSQVVFPSFLLTRHNVNKPDKFLPDRWETHPEQSFLPFASGKHNCVGQSLALSQISWVLSRLCAHYCFEVESEGEFEYGPLSMKCVGTRLTARRIKFTSCSPRKVSSSRPNR